jgi:hypothetical protein
MNENHININNLPCVAASILNTMKIEVKAIISDLLCPVFNNFWVIFAVKNIRTAIIS